MFNHDKDFQLYVIDHIPLDEPVVIKLHIESEVSNEFSDQQVREAVHSYVASWHVGFKLNSEQFEERVPDDAIEIRQFPRKNQIKVFLRLTQERGKIKSLFQRLFKEHEIRIEGR